MGGVNLLRSLSVPNLPMKEAEVWRRLVGAMKPGWASGATQDLIVLFCF